MSTTAKWDHQTLALEVDGASLELDALVSHGRTPPVLFLHGFGSTKEDYADLAHIPNLAAGGFIAFDAPGFGCSMSSDLSRVSIEFLVDVADAVLKRLAVDEFHVVGHSMGGLTALMLALRAPDRVLSFVNIEGTWLPRTAFSVARSSTPRPTTQLSSWRSSLPGRIPPRSSQAPCMPRACGRGCVPKSSGASSSPSSISPTTVTSSPTSRGWRCPGCSCTANRTRDSPTCPS